MKDNVLLDLFSFFGGRPRRPLRLAFEFDVVVVGDDGVIGSLPLDIIGVFDEPFVDERVESIIISCVRHTCG